MDRRSFFKSSFLSLAGFFVSQMALRSKAIADSGLHIAMTTKAKWKNWAQNISFRPERILVPKSLVEVQSIINKYDNIRVVGSGHSFSALVPGRTLVSLKSFNDIFINSQNMEVTVGSGVKLEKLLEALNERSLALPTMGDIDQQTVGGLIATATKGTGIQFGSFSDEKSLLGLSMVNGKGEFLQYDFRQPEHKDIAEALRLGLGSFGIVLTVKFRIVPAFNLMEESKIVSLNEALKPECYLGNYRYAFYYYPFSNKTVQKIQNTTSDVGSLVARTNRKLKIKAVENYLANSLLHIAALFPSLIPTLLKTFFKTFKDETYTDSWHEVMITQRTMRYFEMQYSIPIANLEKALKACQRQVISFAEQGLYYSDLPFYVRFTRGDQGVLLSPSQGDQLFAHIDVNAHHAQKDYEAFFKAVEAELVQLGGRPHWGKQFYINPSSSYGEKIARFERVRQEFDPENKFQNQFVKRYISGS